ncbi:MAG: family 10 glycosylhydrolase [Bacteroidota bacterium]|nr:family 10 glycosylhydrolase [Bacteroidota bacterium]
MKKIVFLLLAFLTASALFIGCDDKAEEEILTRPLIKFKDGVDQTMEGTYMVSATITSDQALEEVKIEKIFPGKEEPNEVVETITSFPDSKFYVFEKEFTVPATVQKMQIKVHAITIYGLYSDEIFTFISEQSAYSQSAIISALAAAYAQFESTGEMPDEVKVSGVTLNKADYYEAACRVLLQIQKGVDDPITLTGYPLPAAPDADNFIEKEIPIELLFNQTTRQMNYAANNNVFANYVSYPQSFVGPEGEKYTGQFSFNRSAVVLARALAYYKEHSKLPAKLSSLYKVEPEIDFQELFITAYSEAYDQFEATGKFSPSIMVNNENLNSTDYFEAACRVLLNLYNQKDDDIPLSGYNTADDPSLDSFEESEIVIELLVNQAERQLKYAANNQKFASYVSYPQTFVGPNNEIYNGKFSFNRGVVVMARALAHYKVNGSLPAKLSSSYLKESTGTPIGVWMWGSTLSDDNLEIVDKLASNHVDDVYLLVKGTDGTKMAANKLTDFVTKAHEKEIKVHFWYIINEDSEYVNTNPKACIYHCPKPGTDLNPYPMNDKRVNLLYPGYKEYVLDNIKDFVRNFDCDGIHLDYIRYGHFVYSFDKQSLERASSLGCDTTRLLSFFQTEANYKQYATNSGFVDLYMNNDPDVVKWVEMRNTIINEYIVEIKEAINSEKPNLSLSASFMPEGVTDPKYANVFYAQDYVLNAATLDKIIPMAYFKAYGKPTSWLKTITEAAKQLVGDKCDIYTGVQGYDGVTANQLNEQIQFSISGGADGVAIFRYETIPAGGWEVIKEWGQ